MQLTTARLKQIIKEELEAITNEMSLDDDTTVDTQTDDVDAEVASLEQQLAEAKKKAAAKKSKTGGMKMMKGDSNTHKSAKSAMKTMGKKG